MADALSVVSHDSAKTESRWVPRGDLMTPLIEMGISQNAAKRGLYHTGNISVDAAASWVFDNIDDPDINSSFEIVLETPAPSHSDDDPENATYKMVFVVNNELKMGVGKIAAQVAHAGLGLQKLLLHGDEISRKTWNEWEQSGSTKIVLKGVNASQLMEMEIQAKEAGHHCDLVVDAGRTQVAAASVTVLGIFGKSEDLNKITGTLPLL